MSRWALKTLRCVSIRFRIWSWMNSIRPWLINSPVQWSIWERAAWEHWRGVSLVWRNPQVTPRVYTTSHLTTSNRYTRSLAHRHTHNHNTTVSIETLFVCGVVSDSERCVSCRGDVSFGFFRHAAVLGADQTGTVTVTHNASCSSHYDVKHISLSLFIDYSQDHLGQSSVCDSRVEA